MDKAVTNTQESDQGISGHHTLFCSVHVTQSLSCLNVH